MLPPSFLPLARRIRPFRLVHKTSLHHQILPSQSKHPPARLHCPLHPHHHHFPHHFLRPLHLHFHPLFACIIHTDVLRLAGNLLPPHPSLPVLLKLLQLLLLLNQLLIFRFQPFSSSCFFLLKTKRLDQHVVRIVVCRLRFFFLVSPHGSDALPLVQVFPALVKVVGLLLGLLVSSPFLSLLFLALSDQVLYEPH